MAPEVKVAIETRLIEAHARANRHIQKLEIDLGGQKLDHQKARIYRLMEYHLKAKGNARLALEELDKL